MKKAILVTIFLLAGNAMADQNLCDVQVQDANIIAAGENPVGYVRALFKEDNMTVTECITDKGIVAVGIAPNGEVRAVIF